MYTMRAGKKRASERDDRETEPERERERDAHCYKLGVFVYLVKGVLQHQHTL